MPPVIYMKVTETSLNAYSALNASVARCFLPTRSHSFHRRARRLFYTEEEKVVRQPRRKKKEKKLLPPSLPLFHCDSGSPG